MISEQKVWKVLQHKDRELKEHATVSIFIVWQKNFGGKIFVIFLTTTTITQIVFTHNIWYVPQSQGYKFCNQHTKVLTNLNIQM